jgi:hypothetical protein
MGARTAVHRRARLMILLWSLLMLPSPRAWAWQQSTTSPAVKQAADTATELRVVVSIKARRLWVIGANGDSLRTAPVAVGSGRRLTSGARSWVFATPIGIRSVVSTEVAPAWIRPDWAYVELAQQLKLRLDSVSPRRPRALSGGDSLVMRGAAIGVLKDGVLEPWPAEQDIVIGRVLYMPPLGTPYRAVAGALGPYRLNLGGALGLHGTTDKASVGKAVTHGCMRLHDDDLTWLYLNVPVGTRVFIY